MTLHKLLLICFSSLLLVSCNNDNLDQYEGVWQGSFAGDRAGTWKIGIDEDGSAKGVMTPVDQSQGFSLSGRVNDSGELVMTAIVFGRDAVYNAFLTESNLDGNWNAQENDFRGTWSGTKNKRDNRFPYGLIINP